MDRREFMEHSALVIGGAILNKPISSFANKMDENLIIGHGNYKYKVDKDWGKLDASKYPVNDCHEMVIDSKLRLFLLTNEPKNNILI